MINRVEFVFAFGLILLIASTCEKDNKENPVPSPVCESFTLVDVETISIFPNTHPINMSVSSSAEDSRSQDIIDFISEGNPGIKADFGSGLYNEVPIGIPFVVVCNDQPKISITF